MVGRQLADLRGVTGVRVPSRVEAVPSLLRRLRKASSVNRLRGSDRGVPLGRMCAVRPLRVAGRCSRSSAASEGPAGSERLFRLRPACPSDAEVSNGWLLEQGRAISPVIDEVVIETWPWCDCGFEEWYFFSRLPEDLGLSAYCNWTGTSIADWASLVEVPTGLNLRQQLETAQPDVVLGEGQRLFAISRNRALIHDFLTVCGEQPHDFLVSTLMRTADGKRKRPAVLSRSLDLQHDATASRRSDEPRTPSAAELARHIPLPF